MTGKAVTTVVVLITGAVLAAAWPVPADDVRYTGQADLAPFAYAYRKASATNPIETRWLNPQADVLCGL